MADVRDDFSEQVKRTVAERAAYICSNPGCRRPTVEPHSDPNKSLKTGIACHIRGAAPGGPRYDPQQTQDQRRGIENAIWLCGSCSPLIDKDEQAHPVSLVTEWKEQHETWIKNGGIIPRMPSLSLKTLAGRTIPEVPGTISLPDEVDAREHRLILQNIADVEIGMIDALVQLPEPVVQTLGVKAPPGIHVSWQPHRMEMMAVVSGSGTVTRNRPPLPTNVYRLQIDRIPPSHGIEVGFLTSMKPFKDHDISLDDGPFARKGDQSCIDYFVLGQFQFEYRGAIISRRIFSSIAMENRRFVASELREDFGDLKPRISSFFS